jgi:SAM-dependent methyltransferase
VPVDDGDRNPELLDPVSAYDRVAPFYREMARPRQRYLERIEQLVIARVPRGSRSLLDVGAGDGARTFIIAQAAGLDDVVLLEPSCGMVRNWQGAAEVWAIRAEELGSDQSPSDPLAAGHYAGASAPNLGRFDVITCLWNVLGHIRPSSKRADVLGELSRMLSSRGLLFVDVNHRYNIRSYGLFRTVGRYLWDHVSPDEANGDVTASWKFGSTHCSTYGHVFTDKEIGKLAAASRLRIKERLAVDYERGAVTRFGFQGSLLYVFDRGKSEEPFIRGQNLASTGS